MVVFMILFYFVLFYCSLCVVSYTLILPEVIELTLSLLANTTQSI